MRSRVIVEDDFSGILLSKVIAKEQRAYGVEVVAVGSLSSIYSFARTTIATLRVPVAVIIDADSPEPEMASLRRRTAEEVIGDITVGVSFKVLVAVPELEIVFFQAPDLLPRVFGQPITEHLMEVAQLSPRRALQKLDPSTEYERVRFKVIEGMTASDIQSIRETDLLGELLTFLVASIDRSNDPALSRN